MLDQESMVWAWTLELFFKMVWSALRGLPTTPLVSGGHERALMPLLLVFLFGRAIRGAFAGILISPHLAIEAIKDGSNCFFARGVAGGDV